MGNTEAPEKTDTLWPHAQPLFASGVSPHSTYLFPLPSILYGIGRVLDLGGQLDSYNHSLTFEQADVIALANDWLAASQDVRRAAITHMVDHLKEFLDSDEGRIFTQELIDKLAIAVRG